jgi:hypothetical protein
VAAVVGNQPSRVSAALERTDRGWQMRLDGVSPPIVLDSPGTEAAGVSIRADSSGDLVVSFGKLKAAGRLTPGAPPLVPPHPLTFDDGGRTPACAVVWLEIPFPLEAAFGTTAASSPTP